MNCQKCGYENPDMSKFCKHCGSEIEKKGISCPNNGCGRQGLPPEALFCPDCGFSISSPEIILKSKSGRNLNQGIIISSVVVIGVIVVILVIGFFIQYDSAKSPAQENSSSVSDNSNGNSGDDVSYNSLSGKYPFASTRYLTSDDLNYLSKFELKIMRNEVFARHGFVFQTADMNEYFNSQTWYKNIPKLGNNDEVYNYLSEIEKSNIKLIKSYE